MPALPGLVQKSRPQIEAGKGREGDRYDIANFARIFAFLLLLALNCKPECALICERNRTEKLQNKGRREEQEKQDRLAKLPRDKQHNFIIYLLDFGAPRQGSEMGSLCSPLSFEKVRLGQNKDSHWNKAHDKPLLRSRSIFPTADHS